MAIVLISSIKYLQIAKTTAMNFNFKMPKTQTIVQSFSVECFILHVNNSFEFFEQKFFFFQQYKFIIQKYFFCKLIPVYLFVFKDHVIQRSFEYDSKIHKSGIRPSLTLGNRIDLGAE